MKKLVSSLLAALALIGATTAQAQEPKVIDYLPYTISASGPYVLNTSLSSSQASGNLITVAVSNVSIDLQGNFISGPVGNTAQTTNGIYGREVNNVTVKNGTVANVRNGINLIGNGSATTNNLNHELDHLRITHCNYSGISLLYAASATVTNCKISSIGISGNTGTSIAINIFGKGVTVQNCAISQGLGSYSYGISSEAGSFARQNTISGFTYGVYGGTYQDNLTYGCTTAFSGGVDAGGNK